MHVTRIHLRDFRSFADVFFSFSSGTTLIVGNNARGKTTILEGLYAGLIGKGFRESREAELIRFDQSEGYLELVLADGDNPAAQFIYSLHLQLIEGNRVKKTCMVNRARTPWREYRRDVPPAVLFAPEQIQIITGSPSRRRSYMDEVLSIADPAYGTHLRKYELALRRRNKVLELYTNERKLEEEMYYWNGALIEHATYLSMKRQQYCAFLNHEQHLHKKEFSLVYHADLFSEERLRGIWPREKMLRRTLIGPHKDDYVIYLHAAQKKDVRLFGSRSEQRMALFWLKLAEMQYLEGASGVKSILLLDDIFSELDDENRLLVTQMMRGHQVIATSAEDGVQDLLGNEIEAIRL